MSSFPKLVILNHGIDLNLVGLFTDLPAQLCLSLYYLGWNADVCIF